MTAALEQHAGSLIKVDGIGATAHCVGHRWCFSHSGLQPFRLCGSAQAAGSSQPCCPSLERLGH